MQIHELKVVKKKDRKRVGRGGKRGTFSGRGMNGQKSRSGASIDPLFEGGRSSMIERLKKVRGFKSQFPKKSNVNLNDLEDAFKDGDIVSIESLKKVGLLDRLEANRGVKILGDGELKKKITVSSEIGVSVTAKNAIEKAGGKIEIAEKKEEVKKKQVK